jgi:hypothetical protein
MNNMKNIKALIFLSFFLVMISCNKENDQIRTFDLGSEMYISSNGYSSLNSNVTFTVNNPLQNLSEVTVTALGITDADGEYVDPPVVDFGAITFTDGVATLTISRADLGISEVDWEAQFEFDAVIDGKPFSRYSSVTVSDPVTLTSPYIWELNDDVLEQTSVTVYQNDNVAYISYSVDPPRATAESILIETKVGAEGVYTVVAGNYNPVYDSLAVVGSDYNANDTVYYQFTSKIGTNKQVSELNFIVNKIEFPNEGGTRLTVSDNVGQGFDLVKNEIVDPGTVTADMEIVHVVLSTVGFESSNGTLFVATDADVYANNDVVVAKALFSAGTKQSGFANVTAVDYFIYKTSRGTDDYYGIIHITGAFLATDGVGDDFIEFEYRY